MTYKKGNSNWMYLFLVISLSMVIRMNLNDERNQNCEGVEVNSTLYSPKTLTEKREKTSNSFYSRYQSLIDYYEGDRSSNTYLKIFDWEAGLYFTLMALIIISFIIFLFSCCFCKDKCLSTRTGRYHFLSIGFFIAFTILFIAMIVFIVFVIKAEPTARCQLYNIPNTLIYGSPGVSHEQEFIGYRPFISFLDNFKSEVKNISSINQEMKEVVDSKIVEESIKANDDLLAIYKQHSSDLITDSDGKLQTPLSQIYMKEYTNNFTGSQFEMLDILTNKTRNSATEARFLSEDSYVEYTNNGLEILNSYLKSNVDPLETFLLSYVNKAMDNKVYAYASFWTFFGLSIFLFVFALICIIVLICVEKGKCRNCFTILKVIVTLFAFFVLLFSIAVLFMMFGTVASSAICKFISQLNRGSIKDIEQFKNFLDPQSSILVETCLSYNSTGDLMTLTGDTEYTKETYSRLTKLIDGQNSYNEWRDNKINKNTTFEGIDRFTDMLDSITLGKTFDLYGIKEALDNLNTKVSCSSVSFAFSKNVCGDCTIISSSSAFTPDSCVSDKTASETLYKNLQSYINQVNLRNTSFKNEYSPELKDSFNNAENLLEAQYIRMKNLNDVFKNTLKSVENYDASLDFISKCTNLKVEMQLFESALCFDFGYWLYILFVIAVVSVFVLFMLMWTMCLSIRTHQEKFQGKNYMDNINLNAIANIETVPEL